MTLVLPLVMQGVGRLNKRNEMEFIVELIAWFIIEVMFWGIMFWTGYVLILIATFGQWTPGYIGKDKEKNIENRRQPRFLVTAIIGTFFWIGCWIVLIIILNFP